MKNNKENILKVNNIHKSYKNGETVIEVLKGVDFTVKRGEVLSIMGPSGAGKSTLLNIIGTLELPDNGEILYNNINPFDLDEKRLAKFRNEKIGFVFQFHHLLPEFTALENVMVPSIIYNDDFEKAREKAHSLLDRVGLGDRINHKPAQLSGGERQRVAVARAMINNPEVILADEPTGNLDIENGENLLKLILDLNTSLGVTFIIATHNLEVSKICARTIYLRDGKIVHDK